MNHLEHAKQVAMTAHEGQSDKIGRPFLEHCRRVAAAVSGDAAKTVAYLHDVVEKGNHWTLDRLREEGFARDTIIAVDAMTRRTAETLEDFTRRAMSNPLARPVKQADLEDNLWQCLEIGENPEKYERGLEIVALEFERR